MLTARRPILLLFGAAAMALLTASALWIWPTPYRTLTLRATAPQPVLAAREHRLTGQVELLTAHGWRPAVPPPNPFAGFDSLEAELRRDAERATGSPSTPQRQTR